MNVQLSVQFLSNADITHTYICVYSTTYMMSSGAWTVIIIMLTLTTALTANSSRNITTLRILLIAPFPDNIFRPPYDGGHNLIPSGLLAVEEINNDTRLLHGYNLEPIVADGGCASNGKAVSSLLENVVHRNLMTDYIIGIVGPVCSEATQALSDLVNRDRVRLPVLTVANSPELANITRYPFTYGVVSTSAEYAEMVVILYRELSGAGKWKNISFLYDSNRFYHLETYRSVLFELEKEGVSLDSVYGSPISQTYLPLEDIFNAGIRIVFVFSSKEPACMLVCRALHLGMTYPEYQFIFTDRTLGQFQTCANGTDNLVFDYNSRQYKCSNNEIVAALDHFILFQYNLEALSLEPNTTRAVSGNNFKEYRYKYEQRLKQYNATVKENLSASRWAAPFYDAVWALALAANQTLPNLNLESRLAIWDEHQLTNTFNKLTFRGVSSMVDFNPETGYSDSIISIFRLEYYMNEIISDLKGHYDAGKLHDKDVHNSSDIILSLYINSGFDKSTERLPLTISIPGYTLSFLVLVATIIYHILHFYYRHRPSLKAASPQLNHFIFLGCYILLISVILDTADVGFSPENTSRHLKLCYAVVWFENIGVTLVFSTLFVKYYRLYLVFLKTYDHRPNLSNYKLSLIVLGLVAIEFVILAIWIPFEPLKIETTVELDLTSTHPVHREKKVCVTTGVGKWLAITASLYLAVLILAVVTLSIINRRIKQRDFNTTTATNVLVYLFILLLAILLPSAHVRSNYSNINLKYGLINAVYLTFTVLCLILLFTPPLLLKDKRTRLYSLSQQLHKISALVALNTNVHVHINPG